MKVSLNGTGVLAVGAVVAVGVIGYFAWDWLKKNKDKFNPTSTNNFAYEGANAVFRAVSGNQVDTIGTAAGGVWKSDAERKVDEMLGAVPKVTQAQTPGGKSVVVPTVSDAELGAIKLPDYGYKPVPIGEARVIGTSGVLTSGEYRDLVR